jgi:hypothetical protein
LECQGYDVDAVRHLPRRGLAEHRSFLLSQAEAPYVLFLDDDLLIEKEVIARLLHAIEAQECGFVGAAPIGLSYRDDVRPEQQAYELSEQVTPSGPGWQRHALHNAANLLHVQEKLGLGPGDCVPYKVAWVGGCVLYDRRKLLASGGFDFWPELPPEHCGEDVLAQMNVMQRFGGCGIMPSGVYHQELPTTVSDRSCDAPLALPGWTGARASHSGV